jgi:glycosyltransferase involved in cell wall biosynthesis
VRITFVVPRYLPRLGGIENHVAAVASRVHALGHEVTVATQREGDATLPDREETPDGMVIRRFDSRVEIRGQGISPPLWRWVRAGADQAELVHVQNFHALTSVGAVAATRAPLVFTPHYLGPGEGAAERGLHAAYTVAMRRALRRAARIVCVTPSEVASFDAHVGFRERCRVIPNGIDLAAIAAAAPVDVAGPLVVTAGRLEEYKQPQVVLEAFAHLPPDVHLAVLGTGPMDGALRRRAAELDVAARVHFPGRLAPEAVYGWYRRADVVVSLSRRECFGLTLAEGLAAGARVVASDIGPHGDVVAAATGERSTLVPTDATPAAVAAAIAPHLGRRGPAPEPTSLLTWDAVAAETVRLYAAVLDEA